MMQMDKLTLSMLQMTKAREVAKTTLYRPGREV